LSGQRVQLSLSIKGSGLFNIDPIIAPTSSPSPDYRLQTPDHCLFPDSRLPTPDHCPSLDHRKIRPKRARRRHADRGMKKGAIIFLRRNII